MFKSLLLISFIVLLLAWFSVFPIMAQTQGIKKAIYFYSENCPRCDEADQYLNNQKLFEKYEIKKISVSGPYNLGYLSEFFSALGVNEEKRGWPVIFFGNQMLIGSQPIIDDFAREMEIYGTEELPAPETIGKAESLEQVRSFFPVGNFELSWSVVFTAALVDSINPCVIGVAIVLLFANLKMKGKKESFVSNLFFLAGLTVMYFLFGVFAYSNDIVGIPQRLLLFTGFIIILLGSWGLKNIFSIGRFFHLHVDIKKLYEQKKLFVNFISTRIWMLFLGMAVFFLLLPSTVSPYLGMISLFVHQPSVLKNILYLIVYNLIFILPLALLAWLLSLDKFQLIKSKKPVLVRIIGAVIMIFVGFYLIFVRV